MEDIGVLYDETTEDSILGSILINPNCYNDISPFITDDEIFYQKRARMLWKKLKDMIQANIQISMVSVIHSLTKKDIQNGITKIYIARISDNYVTKGMEEFYVSKLYEKYLLRKIVSETNEIRANVLANNEQIYDSLGEAHTLLGELLSVRPTQKQDMEEIIGLTMDSLVAKEENLIKTGYSNIDRFAGGLTRGEVTIIGGRPGHGKTTFMLNLLFEAIHNGHRVCMFNRELPNTEVIKKIICMESGKISYSMLRKGILSDAELGHLELVKNKMIGLYRNDNFLMFDNIRDFSKSSAEVKRFKPDIIFDDYVQLVSYKGREEQRRLQLEELVNNYKWLGKEMNCVVILASQLNRGVEFRNGMPQLSDLAESGAIEQVAENVFFVFYDYKVKGEKSEKGKNVITISARKVRYGETGDVDLGFEGDKCRFYNTQEEMFGGTDGKREDEPILPF